MGSMASAWKIQSAMAVVAALLVGGVMAYRQPEFVYEHLDRRPLPPIETIQYASASLDQNYELIVQLPPGYAESGKRYPVLYALDGRAAAELYSSAVLPLVRRREIDEYIIVGIAYADSQRLVISNTLLDTRRVRDFTPVPNTAIPQSGQADTFLTFLQDKVVPFIDATYRTDTNDRAIGGYELGGLFAFYAVLSRPELFQRCLAIDPRFSWQSDHIFTIEAEANTPGRPWAATVYFAALGGESTAVSGGAIMADTLRSRGFPRLSVYDEVISGHDQYKDMETAVANGFQFFRAHPLQ